MSNPWVTVNQLSELWIDAKVIGFTKGGNHITVQVRLNDGTVMIVDGIVKLDRLHNA